MNRKLQILRDTFASELFGIKVIILYIGFAIVLGLIVGVFATTASCMISPPSGMGFFGCTITEFSNFNLF